jgi:pimeloyl-ACP methyl ester carboxylesterase
VDKQSASRGASYVVVSILGALSSTWLPGTQPGATAAGAPRPDTLTVGRLTLHRCATAAPWCATLVRPLDPEGKVAGTIPVYFEYYPHSGPGPAAGTLVATEGGPGFPATESRGEYLALFGPLRARYDVLIMDNRGTGRSGAIDCRELQQAERLTESNIGGCGRSLGAAAPLYGTAPATDDLAAILEALATGPVGLYGDSYGSYFTQVFALRHRGLLRAAVLDGAYPLDGPDYPWYPHYAPAMRDKFNLACERDPACRALGGSSLDHIAPALARLRAQPRAARVRYGDGRSLAFTADATALAIVLFGGSPAFSSVREADAAARAYTAGDPLPLERLMAETLGSVDSRDPTHAPGKFSAGLAAAVSCQDPAQIFDMRLPPAQRLMARDQLIAQRKARSPGSYAPFTIDEYRGMPLDYAFIDQCVEWPSPPAAASTPLVYPDAAYPDTPVLVVSGELDNMTSPADGAAAAARFPRARHLIIANSLHVNALPHARSECAAALVRRFLTSLSAGDESCAAGVPPVRLVPRFARTAHELEPARAAAGNVAGEEELRVVSAVLLTAQDAIARAADNGAGSGVGLRGGTFTVRPAPSGYRLMLSNVRWTSDVAVSGSLDWPGRTGEVRAQLTVRSPGGRGPLALAWTEGMADARATARGALGGNAVSADAPAP